MPDKPTRFSSPTRGDWLLLTVNIVFVAMSLIILPSDFELGITSLTMFGGCLVFSAAIILRKYRFQKFSAETVRVLGGVPIRPKTTALLVMSFWLLAFGLINIIVGQSHQLPMRVLSVLIAVLGAVLVLGVFAGWWPRGFVQFDPAHFTIGYRNWLVRVPWDEIAAIQESELHSNPVLLIAVGDLTTLVIEPPGASGRAMKGIASTRSMTGTEFMIMTARYGIDLPVFSDAIARYAKDVSARTELHASLAGPKDVK